MPQLGQSAETSYMPSEGYKSETRNIRMPSEQNRSPRMEDRHFREHSPFSARDPRIPRTLPERKFSHSPSPGFESPDAQSPNFRYREIADSAAPSHRLIQGSHEEIHHHQPRPSSRPSQSRTAHFDKSRIDSGRARPGKSELPKPALAHVDHSSPQKSKEGPKKTVHFADDPTTDSAPRKRSATASSRGHWQTPSLNLDSSTSHRHHHHHSHGEAIGTHPVRGQSTYYHVPSPPPTPRIPREPTPDFDTKDPFDQAWDSSRYRFCACCPPSSAGCDKARGKRISAKMDKQLGDAREHILRTSSKGTRRIGEA
ncbi:hypothetical protein F4810DRAFT_406097 [Camillea tinctor]|nr:hypothetical protein F4810DRAFT_406097 [Camillea tinctor]